MSDALAYSIERSITCADTLNSECEVARLDDYDSAWQTAKLLSTFRRGRFTVWEQRRADKLRLESYRGGACVEE